MTSTAAGPAARSEPSAVPAPRPTGRRRLATLSVLGLVGAVALTGCGALRPGAAAVVGGERISLATVQNLTTDAKADDAVATVYKQDPAKFERSEVAELVNARLLQAVAADRGITLDQGMVAQRRAEYVAQTGGETQLIAAAAQAGLTPAGLVTFLQNNVLQSQVQIDLVKDVPVSQADLQAAYDKQASTYNRVTAAHILVADKATADKIFATVKADPSTFAAQAAKYSTDTATKDKGGALGTFGKGEFASDFETPVFKAAVGSIIEIHTQFGWHVVRIDAHKMTTLAEATPQLRLSILATQANAALIEALTKKADQLGVSINPRYGKYDVKTQTVVDAPRPAISPAG